MSYQVHARSRITDEIWDTVSIYGEVVCSSRSEALDRCWELNLFFPGFIHTPVKLAAQEESK